MPEERVTEGRLDVSGPPRPRRFGSLLVMSRAGVFTTSLPVRGEIAIGRAGDCDVRLDDPLVSRLHAVLRIGDRCELVDRGSANGSLVGDRRVAPGGTAEVRLGELITVGSTVLVVQEAVVHGPTLTITSRSAFDEALAGALTSPGSAFALLRVGLGAAMAAARATTRRGPRSVHDEIARAQRLERTLGESLRPGDLVAAHGAGGYEMLLSGVAPDTADAIVAQLRTRLQDGGFEVRVGHACHPRDGADARALRARSDADPGATDAPAAPRKQLDGGVMQRFAATLDRVASSSINVLILGETGVGKEVMARTLHTRSPRGDAPLVSMNCAAFSEQLIESELFGHEKGSFTGAAAARPGLLESANGGTVFLDEIAEMPLSLQAKLLRVLEAREVLRVGAVRPRPIDVRFVAATNRDLAAEVAAGRFRQDLYFRLNGITIAIPPLRDRADEIESLARAFLAEACAQTRRAQVPELSAPALALLRAHQWPGNIRELRNLIERAALLCAEDVIGVEHCVDQLCPLGPPPALPAFLGAPRVAAPAARATIPVPKVTEAESPQDEERRRLVDALDRCAGNQTHAAEMLGISRRTLINRLEEYQLPRPRKRGAP